MTTYVRQLDPGDRFYLLRTMQRFVFVGRNYSGCGGTRHVVLKDGDSKESTLHHSCHVKRIVRAA